MKEILVTGATGFIGQNIVPLLVELGYKPCLITKSIKRCAELFINLPIEIIEWDINNGPLKHNSLKTIPDTLLHLAWQDLPNYESLHHIEENFIRNYAFIKGCVELGTSSIIVTGTCLEYGMKSGCLEVNDDCTPITSYGLSKHLLHNSLLLLKSKMDFSLAWARLFYLTGEGQSANSIIPRLDRAIDKNEYEFKVSGGEQLRDYTNVNQVAQDLSTLVVQNSNGIFNICSGKPISIRKLLEDRIKERRSSIVLNLGYYPYNEYEPFAFWGKPNIPKKVFNY